MPRPGVLAKPGLGELVEDLEGDSSSESPAATKADRSGNQAPANLLRGAWVGGCQGQPAGVLGDTTSLATRTIVYHKPPPFLVEPDPVSRRANKNPAAVGQKLVPRAASARTLATWWRIYANRQENS